MDNSKLSIDKIITLDILITSLTSKWYAKFSYKNIKEISNTYINALISAEDKFDPKLFGLKISGIKTNNLILKWLIIDRRKFYDKYNQVKPNPELFEYFDYIFKENDIQNLYVSTTDMINGKNIAYQIIKKSKDGYKYKKVSL